MRRLRPFQSAPKLVVEVPASPPTGPSSKFDLWLQRVSLVSQPLLLLTALATIQFTVIPLYEKAQLDEALARREIELKNTTAMLNARYGALRRYIGVQFARDAHFACAYTKGEMDWLMTPPGQPQVGSREAILRDKLQMDVAACVRRVATASGGLRDLNAADQQAMSMAIEGLGKALAPMRAKAIEDFDAAPARAKKEPMKYLRDGSNRREVEAALAHLGVQLPPRDLVADATADLREEIVSEYTDQVVTAIPQHLRLWK